MFLVISFLIICKAIPIPKGAVASADTQCISGQIKNMVEYIRQKGLHKEYIFYRSPGAGSVQVMRERMSNGNFAHSTIY